MSGAQNAEKKPGPDGTLKKGKENKINNNLNVYGVKVVIFLEEISILVWRICWYRGKSCRCVKGFS